MAIINIIQQIDLNALTNPNKVAYELNGVSHTYAELKNASDYVACRIDKLKLHRETPIIVYGSQTFEMVATFLGSVKAGHPYIPIDTHSPKERLSQIEEIANPDLIIPIEPLPDVTLKTPVEEIDFNEDVLSKEYPVDRSLAVKEDQTYYIIFTSGTTGVPKGVQISHRNLLSYVNWTLSDFNLDKNVRALSQAPYSFDLSVMDLYPTLALGGTVCAIDRETTQNFKLLFEALPKLQITEWVSTPSFVEIILLDANFNEKNYSDLTHFLFCGEELTSATAKKLQERFPNADIFNTYGPTEATVAITSVKVNEDIISKYSRLPIGYVKSDTKVWIVDEQNNVLPAGAVGEIMIAGPSVSKGYLNNPEKTTAAFFKDENTQAYRTGDLGMLDGQGLLFYRGRTDFQVKLHGFRIELEDIDANLAKVSNIVQASSVPKYNKDHKVTQLIAYVVLTDQDADEKESIEIIRKEMAENVMEYMIPQRFIFVEKLPMTVNGKIDRKSLMAEVNPNA